MEIRPLTPVFGAEIYGVDAAKADDAAIQGLRDALYEHGVVVLRDQNFTPEELSRYGRKFGKLTELPFGSSLPGFPEIGVISNIKENGKYIGNYDGGRYWHTDGSYIPNPHRASFLYGIRVPVQDGRPLGDTLFASAAAAYDTLPEELRERLRGMHVVNSLANRYGRKAVENGREVSKTHLSFTAERPPVQHPIARPHPVTGRLCLYVNEGYTEGIAELSPAESEELLPQLFAHQTQPSLMYTHHWREGDIVMWDNCLTIHRATFDYPPDAPRLMHRVQVAG